MTSNAPVTQIIHLDFQPYPAAKLDDTGLWSEALNACEKSPGLQRMYWGRSHEHSKHVELHLVGTLLYDGANQTRQGYVLVWFRYVRQSLSEHESFLKSSDYPAFLAIVKRLSADVKRIRHAQMTSWTPNNQALARGAPLTGTAIYYNTTEVWNDYAWPLWTHIVRHIDGCLGCSGGPLLEPVTTVPGSLSESVNGKGVQKNFETGYVVYVGWKTTEKHHAYHHTEHFRQFGNVLRCGNEGFAEYGHIVFEGSRELAPGKGARL